MAAGPAGGAPPAVGAPPPTPFSINAQMGDRLMLLTALNDVNTIVGGGQPVSNAHLTGALQMLNVAEGTASSAGRPAYCVRRRDDS